MREGLPRGPGAREEGARAWAGFGFQILADGGGEGRGGDGPAGALAAPVAAGPAGNLLIKHRWALTLHLVLSPFRTNTDPTYLHDLSEMSFSAYPSYPALDLGLDSKDNDTC